MRLRLFYVMVGALLLAGIAYAQQQGPSGTLISCMIDNIGTLLGREGVPSSARCTDHRTLMVTVFKSDGTEVTDFGNGSAPIAPGHYTLTDFRCDNSGSIAGTSGPIGGITCTSGSWFDAVDARGALNVTVRIHEYGTGSGAWSVYDCMDPPGSGGTIAGIDPPGTEDPANTPSPADPDPLCTKINYDQAGAEILMNGVLPHKLNLSAQTFDYIVVRTDTCTGNCDATIEVQVRY